MLITNVIFLVPVWCRTEVLCTPNSTRPGSELMTSRSWQYISCHWDTCSNHLAISDFPQFYVWMVYRWQWHITSWPWWCGPSNVWTGSYCSLQVTSSPRPSLVVTWRMARLRRYYRTPTGSSCTSIQHRGEEDGMTTWRRVCQASRWKYRVCKIYKVILFSTWIYFKMERFRNAMVWAMSVSWLPHRPPMQVT